METCVFCRIVSGEEPATIVFEDDKVLAFPPLVPVSRGHTLVIPKTHHESLADIDENGWRDLLDRARRLAKVLVREHGASGINLLHASGKDAQQSVLHCHVHLVPRYPHDGLDLWLRQKL
jgi:histidine triad (HIT) family protein